MFLLRRKSDGLWRRKVRYGNPWTDDESKAQIFKTVGGCKFSVDGDLYNKIRDGDYKSWDGNSYPNYKYVKHREWFDQKFEVVPVKITRVIKERV